MTKNLRCIHRHTIDEHPACFAKGLVKEEKTLIEAITKAPEKIPWYKEEGFRIGYLDIETDGLKADWSTMLSWCLKEKDGETTYDVITKRELFDYSLDKRIVASLMQELMKYKIIVGYYTTVFDIPFIRTKALRHNIDFPEYGQIFHWDIYYTVKSKLNLSRKSLENVCDYLNLGEKYSPSKELWRRAKYGDPKALEEIVQHNIVDVELLEKLHNKLEPFAKWMKKST